MQRIRRYSPSAAVHQQNSKRYAPAARLRRLVVEQLESRTLLTTATLIPVKDNTLFSSAPQGFWSNGAGSSMGVGRAHFDGSLLRPLMKFDLSASVPAGATINSASLTIWVNTTFSAGSPNVTVHKVLRDWGEAGSMPSGFMPPYGPAQTGDATWLHTFRPNQMWSTAGGSFSPTGDFSSTVSSSVALGQPGTFYTFSSNTQMVADVQSWVNNPGTNFGWLLRGIETGESGKLFDSRESPIPSQRPTLTIDFTAGSTNLAPTNILLSNASVPENSTSGGPVSVADLTAVDPDPDDTHTFQLVAGAGATDNGLFQISGAHLEARQGAAINFEAKNTLLIRIAATDNGGLSIQRTFTISVTNVNDAPTLNAIANPATVLEDSTPATRSVNLSGITIGAGETSQTLTVTATSNNQNLVPNANLAVTYTSPQNTGSVAFTVPSDQSGTATVTVTVRDSGGTSLGGVDSVSRSFVVSVTAVNDPPTIDPITGPPTIPEDTTQPQLVNLTGLTAGPDGGQSLTVTAASSNPALFANPVPVSYTFPNTTGSVSLAPLANQSGTAIITVTVRDNGGTLNSGDDVTTATFTVSVSPTNDPPTLDAIANPAPIAEDAAQQTINLTGIGAGPNETQTVTVSATTNNPGLITELLVERSHPSATGSLKFKPVANQSGTAIITVKVQDDAGEVTRSFTVSVTAVNDPPAIDPITSPPTIPQDTTQAQLVSLTGLSAGPSEVQSLTVTAASSNPALFANPVPVSYTSPSTTGSVSLTPQPDQFGTATITVTVRDSGGTLNSGVDVTTATFTVSVGPANNPPTLDAIANPAPIAEDAAQQSINLTGIGAGPNETQTVSVSATSNNPGLITDLLVEHSHPSATGSLKFKPVANQSGTAIITVKVQDDAGGADTATRSFTVSVTAVNDPPTLDAIPDPPGLPVNPAAHTINLSGISAGPGETQGMIVFAISSNHDLFHDPEVLYTSPNATASLTLMPQEDATGTAIITVRVMDDGGTAGGGVNSFDRTFRVTVGAPVNVAPSFTVGPDPDDVTDEDGLHTMNGWATAISAGPPSESSQTLVFTVIPNNPALFAVPPALTAAGQLTFRPAPNVKGTATLTVTLKDNGGTENGGVDTSPPQTFQIIVDKPHLWHNVRNPLDVNNSGGSTPVSSIDLLLIFNFLNSGVLPGVPPGAAIGTPFFYDCSADNNVSAIDALRVINFLNSGAAGEGEAPVSAASSDSAELPEQLDDLLSLLAADTAELSKRRRQSGGAVATR